MTSSLSTTPKFNPTKLTHYNNHHHNSHSLSSTSPSKSLSFRRIFSVHVTTPTATSSNNLPTSIIKKKQLQNDETTPSLLKDPKVLWTRYVDWLYQHKELGLYLDVSRVGFSDEFVSEIEVKFVKAFNDMIDIENGSIANIDEGRMVGHYWLRNSKLAPTSFLRKQIDVTLDRVSCFADDVISGKVI